MGYNRKRYITIDGGTTNTRIRLIENGTAVDEIKIKAGAGNRNSRLLAEAIKSGIDGIMKKSKLTEADITAILAAGMITSEFGIYCVPHICVPAGVTELNNGIKSVVIKDITDMPINFIPGVKKQGETLEQNDMMRGEECEFFGISKLLNAENGSLVVLPGSHTKIVVSDTDGKISDFSTSLSGEMISAISGGTILNDAINLDIDGYDKEFLKKGFEYCIKNGLNEALFKVRTLKNLLGADEKSCYSFFIGAVLCADVKKISERPERNVYVGGKKQIKDTFFELLTEFTDKTVVSVSESDVDMSVSLGIISIYEKNGRRCGG